MSHDDKKGLLKKAAEKMLHLHGQNKKLAGAVKEHEKRAHALRLVYKQAELGFGEVPQTHRELEEKVASLLNQDLNVVEKALELTGGNINVGELGNTDFTIARDAEEKFQASILGDPQGSP